MEVLLKTQDELYKQLQKSECNYRKSPKERIKKAYIDTRLENLEELWRDFKKGHKDLISTITDETQKNNLPYFTGDKFDQFEELYIQYRCMLLEALAGLHCETKQKSSSNTLSDGIHRSDPSCDIKLPKITLPTFSGNYNDWQTFYDMFISLIHNNKSLSAVQKLHYLKTSLSGEPEALIRNFATTELNYAEAWKQLTKRRVVEHNSKNLGYTLTLNKFSDWTDAELTSLRATRPSEQHVGSIAFPHSMKEVDQLVEELPDYYDMRIEGFISSVKNQGSCGSCWAFSTTAAVEGALARNNGGRNIDLAEQSMVDCAWGFENIGCSGGIIEGAYKYILKHGLPTQMEYGLYLDEMGKCHRDNMTSLYRIKGFAAVPPLSVNAMKLALYKYGPVTVSINADDALTHYNSGIFFDATCNKGRANHGVTVVGYGKRDGVDYWIVKNSWGEDWGEDGYILMSAIENNCHLLESAYYPVL